MDEYTTKAVFTTFSLRSRWMLRSSVCPPFRAHNAPAAPARVAASARAAAAHPRAASGPARAVSLSRPAPPRRAATGAFARPGHPAAASAFPLPLSRSATFWRDSSQNVTGERSGGAAGRGSAVRASAGARARDGGGAGERAARARDECGGGANGQLLKVE